MAGEQKYLVPLNLVGLELRNAKYHTLATAPTGSEALYYYDSVLKTPLFYNGTTWLPMDARQATNIPNSALATNPLARANHTGTQTASTISDFQATVFGYRLDQLSAPTASVAFNDQKITGLANPTNPQDAATKFYVDAASTTGNAATATALATARSFSLTGVITASGVNFDGTGNVALATAIADGALSIAKTSGLQAALNAKQDTLAYTPANKAGETFTGPVILAADPVTPLGAATKQYVDAVAANAAAGLDPKNAVKWTTDADIALTGNVAVPGGTTAAGDEVLVKNQSTPSQNGIYVAAAGAWARRSDAVQGLLTSGALVLVLGGTYAGSQFYLQTADPITVGTTSQTWITFAVGSTYTNGNGLNLTGNTFSAKPGLGITVDGSGINIDTAVVVRKYSTLVGNGSLTTITVTHNLNSQNVSVALREVATNDLVFCGVSAPSVNTVSLTFATAPASNAYEVTVQA